MSWKTRTRDDSTLRALERRFQRLRRLFRALLFQAREAGAELGDFLVQAGEVVLDRLAGDVLEAVGELRELVRLEAGEAAEGLAEDVLEKLFEVLRHGKGRNRAKIRPAHGNPLICRFLAVLRARAFAAADAH